VDCHHRIKEEGEIDTFCLDGQFEGFAVTVEGPRPFNGCDVDFRFVGRPEQTLFDCSVRCFVYDLNRAVANWNDGHQRDDHGRLDANQRNSGLEVF
jgi:hypothetical protein